MRGTRGARQASATEGTRPVTSAASNLYHENVTSTDDDGLRAIYGAEPEPPALPHPPGTDLHLPRRYLYSQTNVTLRSGWEFNGGNTEVASERRLESATVNIRSCSNEVKVKNRLLYSMDSDFVIFRFYFSDQGTDGKNKVKMSTPLHHN